MVFDPVFSPLHVHDHGPVPETALAVPVVHNVPEVGAMPKVFPCDDPHVPFTGAEKAEAQLAFDPPFDPLHTHDHGPVPATALALPVVHNVPAAGAVAKVFPCDHPHEPFTGGEKEELQLAFDPPLTPLHIHDHGPVPVTALALPVVHKVLAGGEDTKVFPFDEPQDALISGAYEVLQLATGL